MLHTLCAEAPRAIRIVASLDISVQAPRVTLSTPQELRTIRSPLQAQGQIALLIPKGTGGGNPPTGGGDTTLTMQYQFDALGQEGILCGIDFQFYHPFPDTPAGFDLGGWIANIVLGAAVTVAFVGLAVATGGASLIAAGALWGATVGAGVATAAIAVSDYNSGNVRSLGEAVFGITLGASLGAVAGASVAAAPLAAQAYTPLINAQLYCWGLKGVTVSTGLVKAGFFWHNRTGCTICGQLHCSLKFRL